MTQVKKEKQHAFKIKSFDIRKLKTYFNKRTVMMCAMLGVLVVTGAVSLRYSSMAQDVQKEAIEQVQVQETVAQVQADPVMEEESVETFFASYRSERNSVRAQEVAYLDSIIQNRSTEKDVLSQAQTRKLEITRRMEQEVTVEGLLRAKGFSDAIVTLSDSTVNVVVSDAVLTEAQAAQILQIVMDETNMTAQNVKIIPAG